MVVEYTGVKELRWSGGGRLLAAMEELKKNPQLAYFERKQSRESRETATEEGVRLITVSTYAYMLLFQLLYRSALNM